MAWVTLPPTHRGGKPPSPTPALRIISARSGYLNVAARNALDPRVPNGAEGTIVFEEDEQGRFSLRVVSEGQGCKVAKSGRVTVTTLTNAVDGPIPVTLQLAPCDEPGRLIIIGVQQ